MLKAGKGAACWRLHGVRPECIRREWMEWQLSVSVSDCHGREAAPLRRYLWVCLHLHDLLRGIERYEPSETWEGHAAAQGAWWLDVVGFIWGLDAFASLLQISEQALGNFSSFDFGEQRWSHECNWLAPWTSQRHSHDSLQCLEPSAQEKLDFYAVAIGFAVLAGIYGGQQTLFNFHILFGDATRVYLQYRSIIYT